MSPSKDETGVGSSTSRVAMKGFSISSKTNVKAKPPSTSTLGKRPRSTFAHDDSDSEHDQRKDKHAQHEAVTGFGEGGAIRHDERKMAELLVIPKMGNRDWRGEARAKRGKNLLPPEVQAAREAAAKESNDRANGLTKKEGVDVVNSNDAEISWGLSVRKRKDVDITKSELAEQSKQNGNIDQEPGKSAMEVEEAAAEKSVDQEALEALLGTRKEKKGPDLVIPAAAVEDNTETGPISELDAYKRAIAAAPDVSTLEEYELIPVEEFGAALLRGMGWKGEKQGQVKEVKRRQNLLGLGAKELKDAEELGAWVQKSDIKRLNEKSRGGGGSGGGERRPKASEYRREKERRDERREERGGGSYRKERERDRDSGRDRDRHRGRDDNRRR